MICYRYEAKNNGFGFNVHAILFGTRGTGPFGQRIIGIFSLLLNFLSSK